MEPIDTDFDYIARQSREEDPRKRFNWLYIFPVLGLCWVLLLTLAVIFQWSLAGIIDPIMSFMLVVFFVFVGLLFWAVAPGAKRG